MHLSMVVLECGEYMYTYMYPLTSAKAFRGMRKFPASSLAMEGLPISLIIAEAMIDCLRYCTCTCRARQLCGQTGWTTVHVEWCKNNYYYYQ